MLTNGQLVGETIVGLNLVGPFPFLDIYTPVESAFGSQDGPS